MCSLQKTHGAKGTETCPQLRHSWAGSDTKALGGESYETLTRGKNTDK